MSKTAQILSQYSYPKNKPKTKLTNLQIYDCIHKETSLPYTLKIIHHPQSILEAYLRKIKDTISDYTIKIYDIAYESSQNRMVVVQEPAFYGTLQQALIKCKRFDHDDSVFVAKMILNGHIDLLRADVVWFGSQADIQFTENGLKLSWNNSTAFSEKTPIPAILRRISERAKTSSVLPFPPNKMMSDLIAVSSQNASQISLHPILKKKQKILKKKGKNWIAIRQHKVEGEYFQELTYVAVSTEFGLVRVKVMDEGVIDAELMRIYQSRASFVRILDYYTDKGLFYTVSEYANDGTVHQYVKRLKGSNIGLKESQIQFFFFSVIQPLKFIHSSNVRSLNLLHIRNIYIQNGIPKIGEPVPMNQNIIEALIQKCNVPDFYHKDFKKSPTSKHPKFDTYSLGVLLYKLMYTQYPIFPEQRVHIPTSPGYKKSLKSAVQLFLNIGGNLQELQNQLQISDDVKIQVKNNQKVLELITKKNIISVQYQVGKSGKYAREQVEVEVEVQDQDQVEEADGEAGGRMGRVRRFWGWLTTRGKDKTGKYSTIYNSEYDAYRKCITIIVVLILYFFSFFIFFVNGAVDLFNYSQVFTPYNVTILGQTYKIITPNFDQFTSTYSSLSANNISTLNQTLNCRLDNKLYYYDFIRSGSPHWNLYLILGLLTTITILTLKSIQIYKFSTIQTGFHYYNTSPPSPSSPSPSSSPSMPNKSRFALSTYIFFQLWYAFVLYIFYYIFNYVFHEQHLPCFGGRNWIKLTQVLMLDRKNVRKILLQFCLTYLIVGCAVFGFGVASFFQVVFYAKIRYNLLKNPIFVFLPFYLALFIALRMGAYSEFTPSFVNNSQKIIGSSYLDIIGYFPQILVIIQILLCLGIDQLCYKFLFEKVHRFVLEQSHTEELKVYEE